MYQAIFGTILYSVIFLGIPSYIYRRKPKAPTARTGRKQPRDLGGRWVKNIRFYGKGDMAV